MIMRGIEVIAFVVAFTMLGMALVGCSTAPSDGWQAQTFQTIEEQAP